MKFHFKTLTLLTIGCVLASPVMRAEDTPPPPPAEMPHGHAGHGMVEHRLKQLDEKLHLTDDQKTKIATIYSSLETKLKAIRGDESLSREEKRAKAMDAMKSVHDEVRALLTADQQKIFDTMKPERPPHEKGRPHDGPPPPDAPPPPPSGNPT